MTESDLSKDAKHALNELVAAITHQDYCNDDYIALMIRCKNGKITEVDDIDIKEELKAFAEHFLAVPTCSAYRKLPEWVSLDDFLVFLMRNTGKTVRENRFQQFLIHEEESKCADHMELMQEKLKSKSDFLSQRAEQRWQNLQSHGVPKIVQCELQKLFGKWSKSKDQNNALNKHNSARKVGAKERRIALANLLPSKKDQEGLTKKQWLDRSSHLYPGMHLKTFDRDIKTLISEGEIKKQNNEKYRKTKKI